MSRLLQRIFAAYFCSAVWHEGWLERKKLHDKARAIVIFDRVLNEEFDRHNRGMEHE